MSSVVPPPISSKQTPRSRSSCVRQDSADASGSRTVSLMRMPALLAAVTRFWVAATEDVTTGIFASSREPTMPTASRMPSWASTINSCGRTCRISRSSGSEMLRAASTARRTSSRSISRARKPNEIPPRLFTPRTWLPATPIRADSTGTLATPSASSTARRMELTVASRLTMRPLRSPLDSAAPSARKRTCSSATSAISALVLVLPMSRPTRYLSFFAKPGSPAYPSDQNRSDAKSQRRLPCPCRMHAGIRVNHDLTRILEIDRLNASRIRLPLQKIVGQHAEFSGEIRLAKMNRHGLRVVQAREAGHHHAQVLGIAQIDFADFLRRMHANATLLFRTRCKADKIDVLQKLLVHLHARFPLLARQSFGNTGDDGEPQILGVGPVPNYAVGINQFELIAGFEKGDWSAFDDIHPNAVGQDALDGGGLDPGKLFDFGAALIERDAEDAAVAVARELLQNSVARDDVVAGDFNLIRLDEQDLGRIEEETPRDGGDAGARDARDAPDEHTAVKRPGAAAEFFAADLEGLLAAQVARLVVGDKLGAINFRFARCGRAALHRLQAFQITTSCSSFTP